MAKFIYKPAADASVDSEYELHDAQGYTRIAIQVSFGLYVVNEYAADFSAVTMVALCRTLQDARRKALQYYGVPVGTS